MIQKLLLTSSFFLIALLTGCQTKNKTTLSPNQPETESDMTPFEFIQKYMECENDSDCTRTPNPNGFCCDLTYAINKNGYKKFRKAFAKEFEKKSEMCNKEYERGLACASLRWVEPVCVDSTCKLKDKMNGDKIIDNEFRH
ncbi:MAG: hypothetical protein GF335_00225 [Candidatus Moranbacteria bacterium]|nr:hypothetical protein [Candidatus Moranbacteria bacterium]